MANPIVSPDLPAHTQGVPKGEERVQHHGREPGRSNTNEGRTARDATSVSPASKNPIDPRMPNLPPC